MYGIYENSAVIAQFVAPIAVRSLHPVFTTDTLSLGRHISRRTAQRWEIETRLEPLSSKAQDLFVQMVTKGYSTVFTVIMPQNYGVILARTNTGTPLIYSTSGTVGASTIRIQTGTNTGLLPKGTFIKFSNHSKVYITIDNLQDSVSNPTIGIYPPLRVAVPAGTSFTNRDDVLMNCLYDTDVVSGMQFSDGILQDMGQIRILEAV